MTEDDTRELAQAIFETHREEIEAEATAYITELLAKGRIVVADGQGGHILVERLASGDYRTTQLGAFP